MVCSDFSLSLLFGNAMPSQVMKLGLVVCEGRVERDWRCGRDVGHAAGPEPKAQLDPSTSMPYSSLTFTLIVKLVFKI